MIVVRDAAMRKQLAEAMLGGNKYAVQAAPVTVVFAADTGRLACACWRYEYRAVIECGRSDCNGGQTRDLSAIS